MPEATISFSWATLARKYPLSDRSVPTMDSATWCRTPAAVSAARRLRPEVSKNSSTALSSNERELARSTTTVAPAVACLSPSPVMVLIPLLGEAATTSWPPWRRTETVFEPIRPVPPITTIFMIDPPLLMTGDARISSPPSRLFNAEAVCPDQTNVTCGNVTRRCATADLAGCKPSSGRSIRNTTTPLSAPVAGRGVVQPLLGLLVGPARNGEACRRPHRRIDRGGIRGETKRRQHAQDQHSTHRICSIDLPQFSQHRACVGRAVRPQSAAASRSFKRTGSCVLAVRMRNLRCQIGDCRGRRRLPRALAAKPPGPHLPSGALTRSAHHRPIQGRACRVANSRAHVPWGRLTGAAPGYSAARRCGLSL